MKRDRTRPGSDTAKVMTPPSPRPVPSHVPIVTGDVLPPEVVEALRARPRR